MKKGNNGMHAVAFLYRMIIVLRTRNATISYRYSWDAPVGMRSLDYATRQQAVHSGNEMRTIASSPVESININDGR
jgi:hypothetical protein